jgi:type VI secretion system secreted protein VgrG
VFEIKHHQDANEYYCAKSDSLGLRAGQVFTLSGHPDQGLNRAYLILSVKHEMDEHTSAARYQNTLKLMPANQRYLPDYAEPERRVNTLSIANIHSENEAPHLTEEGNYLLTSPHTGKLTHPVRLTTPYAGLNHGWHFPLHDKTQVLVAYLNGHPDQPLVLGALYNDEQRNIVNAKNARQNLLITQSGHTLLMDDTPGAEKIHLHTPDEENSLLLDGTEGKHKIELRAEQGEFHAKIKQGTEFDTEDSVQIEAGRSIEIRAKQDVSFFSDEANFKSESAKDHQMIAGENMSLHADRDLMIRVDKDSQTTVKGSMRTDIESGDYLLKVASGNLSYEAQKNLQLSSATGDLVLKTAGASVTFKADGNIVFSAKKIILDAGNIDIHNAGEGMGN